MSSITKPAVKVYVGGHLPNHINSGHIRDHFKAYEDDIIDVMVMRNAQTKHTLGFAVITFSSHQAAQDAIAKMDGTHLNGTIRLKVEEKHDRRHAQHRGGRETRQHPSDGAAHTICTVTIGNVNEALMEEDLQCLLENMGIHYNTCHFETDGTETKSAVLGLSSLSDAKKVVDELDGKNLLGQMVSVSTTQQAKAALSSNQRQQSVTVKVSHIPPTLTKAILEAHFSQVGDVAGSKIHCTNNPYAHVHFKDQDSAKLAVERLNRSQIDGQVIGVKLYVKDEEQVPPPPRERRGEQKPAYRDQGPPQQGPPLYRDEKPRFGDRRGPQLREQGPPYRDQGPPFREQGPPFREQGPPFREQGPPYRDQGPPFREQGPPFREQGPPFREQGPPFREQGPLFVGQGPPFMEQGPPFREQGPPFREQGPPFREQGTPLLPPFRGQSGEQRAPSRTYLDLHTSEQSVDKMSDQLHEVYLSQSSQALSQSSKHELPCQMRPDASSAKVVITCSPEQWNRLLTVDTGGNSLFQELMFPFQSNPNVQIQPVYEKQVIVITGASEAVTVAKEHIERGLTKDISIDKAKMAAMLHFFPTLNAEIQKQYCVIVSGYSEGSTVVRFEGSSSIRDARVMFERYMQRIIIDSIQLPCAELIPSANKRLEREGLQAFVTQMESIAPTVKLYACDSVQMENAMRVLKKRPFENYVDVPTEDLSPELRSKILDLKATHGVVISIQPNKVLISSYVKDDTHAARQDVERLVAEVTKMSVPLKCSQQHHSYLNMVLINVPTKERQAIVSSLPAEISFMRGEIILTGTRQAIQQAQEKLQSCVLSNLQHRVFKFHCNTRFLSQIKQYVLTPMKAQEELDFVYFDDMSKKPSNTESKEFSIVIFSQIHDHFNQICTELEGLKPCTKRYNLKQGSADIVRGMIETVESKYRVRTVIANQQGEAVLIHALTETEANNCWVEIEENINSKLVIDKRIPLSHMQVRYLEVKCKSELESMKKNSLEMLVPHNSKEENSFIRVKGTVNQVNVVEETLRELFESYSETEFDVESGKSLLQMWKKRWQQIKAQQEQLLDILIEFVSKQSKPDQSCETVTFMVCGRDKESIEQIKTMICTKECKDCVKKKTVQLPSNGAATLSKEFKHLEIGHLNVVVSINKSLNNVTIVTPDQTSDDLTSAEEIIRKYLGDVTLKAENITFSEPVLGLVFASESGKRNLAENFDHPGVSIRFLKPPQIGVSLTGVQSAIDAAKPKVQQIIKDVLQDISEISFNVPGQYSVLLGSGELSHLLAKLQADKAVLCTLPAASLHVNKTIHSIQIKPTVTAHCVKFEIVQGNLVNESVSAIINAANEKLEHIGGLAKAISDAGGPSIQAASDEYVKTKGKLKPGDVACLDGGDLPCSKVIHAVGPQWMGGGQNEETILYFTIHKVLTLADKESLESIALPAISCGVFGVPEDICARSTLKSIRDFCQANANSNIHTIRCVLYDQTALHAFCEALKSYFPTSDLEAGQKVLASGTASNVQPIAWQWQNDAGSFSTYTSDICARLSDQYARNPTATITETIGKHTYYIDFPSMLQTNIKTKTQRRIQRIKPSSSPAAKVMPSSQAQWCYLGDAGLFVPYQPHDSSAIQSMYLNKVPGVLTMNNTAYTFDFNTMHQINVATNYKRPIKFQMSQSEPVIETDLDAVGNSSTPSKDVIITLRGPKDHLEGAKSTLLSKLKNSFSSKTIPLPPGECSALKKKLEEIAQRHQVTYSFEECQPRTGGKMELKVEGLTSAVQKTVTALQEEIIHYQSSAANGETPPEWQPQTKTTELFPLSSGSQEWNHVVQKFQLTMLQARITSVQRIQNTWLWDRYVKHRERLKLKNSGVVNEMELFHGTRNNDPKLIYEGEDGFDMRYSAQGMWGMANYFAVNASYSDSYAHSKANYPALYAQHNISCQKEMFLVKVLTGDSYNCAPNSSLRMPPTKPSAGPSSQLQFSQMKYDTVTGITNGSQVYMAYDNEKAYPAYLITYTH